MLTVLRALGFLPLLLAARVRCHERKLITALRERGATTRANAVTIAESGPVGRWVRQRLLRGEAIGEAGNGRYYLSEAGFMLFTARRRRRAMVVIAVVVMGLGIAMYLGVIS